MKKNIILKTSIKDNQIAQCKQIFDKEIQNFNYLADLKLNSINSKLYALDLVKLENSCKSSTQIIANNIQVLKSKHEYLLAEVITNQEKCKNLSEQINIAKKTLFEINTDNTVFYENIIYLFSQMNNTLFPKVFVFLFFFVFVFVFFYLKRVLIALK